MIFIVRLNTRDACISNDGSCGLEKGYSATGGKLSGYIRKYIWEKYDSKCARCGWAEIHPVTGHPPLEIDHIDGDFRNCNEDNLILICPNCHALTPTYRALNKRKADRKVKGQRKQFDD